MLVKTKEILPPWDFFSLLTALPVPDRRAPGRPRKKGVARLAEIMGRDMWNFFRAGFLAFLGCLPFIIGMFFAVETHALLFMLLAGIIGGPDCRPGAERHG